MPANVDLSYILRKPLLSEKSTWGMNEQRRYTFEVDPRASKVEIKSAVELAYKVRVEGVNTQVRKQKTKALKYGRVTPAPFKLAHVLVHKDDTIELF
jgi:large subunit ribosomal protein L23